MFDDIIGSDIKEISTHPPWEIGLFIVVGRYTTSSFKRQLAEQMIYSSGYDFPYTIKMSCGEDFTIYNPIEIPVFDVSCSCGDENHWFIKWEEKVH